MLYIDVVEDSSTRFGSEADGAGVNSYFSMALVARRDELGRVWILNRDNNEGILNAYDATNITMKGETYSSGTDFVIAFNAQQGANLKPWYGIEWNITNSNPAVTRIASSIPAMNLHADLPIQSNMKGCLLADDGVVNYYLKEDDWSKKNDLTASDLTGIDGQVMVEIPKFFWKFETYGNKRCVKMSLFNFSGSIVSPKMYISAYEASLIGNSLASVVDSTLNNGLPKTSTSRTNFRIYARNRGTGYEMYLYQAHKILFWLQATEFATFNSQLAVNGALTAEGFRQGALGVGVTTAISAEWSTFSAYNPFISCGSSNYLGNYSGEVEKTINDFGGVGVNRTFKVNRYRGVEMPFGHVWKNLDGINLKIQADADGGESQAWVAADHSKFNDSNYEGYVSEGLFSRSNGYMSKTIFGNTGNFLPAIAIGGSTTYFCDYFYTSIPASGESLRTLLLGGAAHSGSDAGFGYSGSYRSPSDATATLGSRLCFIGT